jgi:hypothetical protein
VVEKRLRRQLQERVVRIGALAVLVAAVLPNVTYVGHWSAISETSGHVHKHDQPAPESHSEHCHGDSAQCDAPALVSVTWITGESSPGEPPADLLIAFVSPLAGAVTPGAIDVITPPPRR